MGHHCYLYFYSFFLSVFVFINVKEVAPTGRCRARWIRLVTTDSLDPTRQAGPDPVMLWAEAWSNKANFPANPSRCQEGLDVWAAPASQESLKVVVGPTHSPLPWLRPLIRGGSHRLETASLGKKPLPPPHCSSLFQERKPDFPNPDASSSCQANKVSKGLFKVE